MAKDAEAAPAADQSSAAKAENIWPLQADDVAVGGEESPIRTIARPESVRQLSIAHSSMAPSSLAASLLSAAARRRQKMHSFCSGFAPAT